MEVANHTNTNERYVREWLEQQTIAGIVEVDDEKKGTDERRFRLPPGHVEPLIECSSLNYIVPLAQLFVGATRPLPALLDAYRNGGGVPYAEYGNDLREGQAAINYPAFYHQLPAEWLPAMPDIHARLQGEPPARIADRVHFYTRDASDPALTGQYDLVTAFECVHDMANPVGALRTMRQLAGDHGTVLIVDERVGDTFTAKGNDFEWMMYGWSISHCLPVGMADQSGVGKGHYVSQKLRKVGA